MAPSFPRAPTSLPDQPGGGAGWEGRGAPAAACCAPGAAPAAAAERTDCRSPPHGLGCDPAPAWTDAETGSGVLDRQTDRGSARDRQARIRGQGQTAIVHARDVVIAQPQPGEIDRGQGSRIRDRWTDLALGIRDRQTGVRDGQTQVKSQGHTVIFHPTSPVVAQLQPGQRDRQGSGTECSSPPHRYVGQTSKQTGGHVLGGQGIPIPDLTTAGLTQRTGASQDIWGYSPRTLRCLVLGCQVPQYQLVIPSRSR